MTTKTVTVETERVEEVAMKFCDSCGMPVGDDAEREYATLVNNPKVNRDHMLIDMAVLEFANSFDPNDTEYMHYHQMGNRVDHQAVQTPAMHREIEELKCAALDATKIDYDSKIHVCYECLDDRLSGPEVSAFETLELRNDESEEDDEVDLGNFDPMISFLLTLSLVLIGISTTHEFIGIVIGIAGAVFVMHLIR